MNNDLIKTINTYAEINVSENTSFEALKQILTEHVNYLIQHNFEKLVTLLYRIDVSEARLKQLLQQNSNANAGNIIADLIIERQIQKIESRKNFKQNDNISEEEKW
ncbi:hypothetical protein [Ferruginibacter albus]|uniref:hypothetical protein n=1 Tax=Ferruginibacter albus TaxID=2875540 RepID=UPI001CC54B4F|nr:hypothetical protein [Ferruginibacter albus]UAY52054.1 hypothetical protein K9M53_15875 [Ferruginibacter albus]